MSDLLCYAVQRGPTFMSLVSEGILDHRLCGSVPRHRLQTTSKWRLTVCTDRTR